MKLLTEYDLPYKEPTAVAIGLFDGIHRGHAELIQDIRRFGALSSLVYTFDTKPNHAIFKNIYTTEEKISIFSSFKVDALYMQPFTEAFSKLSKREFIEGLVHDFNAKHITVGFDFRFGRNAEGDAEYLSTQAEKYGYTVCIVPEVVCSEGKISSTLIRADIEHGEMERAAELLGRFYFIDGRIEKGKHLGSAIGFPTANISTDKLMPRFGVYATIVQVDGECFPAVTNVGIRPTVSDSGIPNIETYIFDFSHDVYDEKIRVNFVSFLRPEKAFADVPALQAQIGQDAADARKKLRELEVYKAYIL